MAAPAEPTAGTPPSLIPDSQPLSSQLDNEIATIRAQISTLTHHRSLLRSTLLTSAPTQSLLAQHSHTAQPTTTSTSTLTALRHATTHQAAHNTLTLHRLCAGATMFRVRDPDPHAVDAGRVYGVRIEVFCEGKFLPSYYLLLHRPHPSSTALRIHRHTIPPCIPLPALVARWLPVPKPPAGDTNTNTNANIASGKADKRKAQKQDLPRLVRELRRELVGWHLRGVWVGSVKAGIVGGEMGKGRGRDGVKEVEMVDAERLEVRIEWGDGRVGRVRVGKGGRVERAVVWGTRGRERGVERWLCGGEGRVEGLAWRLAEGSGGG